MMTAVTAMTMISNKWLPSASLTNMDNDEQGLEPPVFFFY